jgi:hypothetical protein
LFVFVLFRSLFAQPFSGAYVPKSGYKWGYTSPRGRSHLKTHPPKIGQIAFRYPADPISDLTVGAPGPQINVYIG